MGLPDLLYCLLLLPHPPPLPLLSLPAQAALTDSYYQVMGLPDMLGLHFLWNEPSINVTQFYDGPAGTISNTTLMSLWDAGNMYGVSGNSKLTACRQHVWGEWK